MNSRIFKHIVFFILGIFFFSQAQAIPQTIINSVQDDTSQVEERTFENLKEKYSGNEFIYERTIENSGWWSRFKQWLSDFFKDLFGLTNKGQASKATTTFIRIAGVLLFLFVVFFIFKAIINKEGKWVFGKS